MPQPRGSIRIYTLVYVIKFGRFCESYLFYVYDVKMMPYQSRGYSFLPEMRHCARNDIKTFKWNKKSSQVIWVQIQRRRNGILTWIKIYIRSTNYAIMNKLWFM